MSIYTYVERSPRKQSVVGSNPTQDSSSSFLFKERGVVDLFCFALHFLVVDIQRVVTAHSVMAQNQMAVFPYLNDIVWRSFQEKIHGHWRYLKW